MTTRTPNPVSTTTKATDQPLSKIADSFVIPDLCQINSVLFTLILSQLLAFFITFISTNDQFINWETLGIISIFCHTVALSFSVVICLTRKYLFTRSARFISLYVLGTNALLTYSLSTLCITYIFPLEIDYEHLFVWKSTVISACLTGILLRYFFLRQDWRKQRQAELQARIQALQARIRPHFLFNSMNSIASLIMIDPQRAEDAVLDLSALFRATLNNQKSLIPIAEEIKLCQQYLNIEGIRLGERLQVEWQLKTLNQSFLVPPLMLQPLFENAIYHGIQPLEQGGLIKVESYVKKELLYILISNPYSETVRKHQGNHIALDNIQNRLNAIYGEQAILKTSQLDGIFTVTLRMPLNRTA